MKELTMKQLGFAQKLYNKIVILDKEIIEIEAMANEIIEDDCELSFNIEIKNKTKKEADKNKVKFDEDGSIDKDDGTLANLWYMAGRIRGDDDKPKNHNFKFSNSECLNVLSFLIKAKCKERDVFIAELNKMGIR